MTNSEQFMREEFKSFSSKGLASKARAWHRPGAVTHRCDAEWPKARTCKQRNGEFEADPSGSTPAPTSNGTGERWASKDSVGTAACDRDMMRRPTGMMRLPRRVVWR